MKTILLFILCIWFFNSVKGQVGTVPINTPTGGFRIDGFLQKQGSAGDWLSGPGGNTAGSYVLDDAGFPVIPAAFDEYFDLWNDNNDDVFLGGRFQDDPNTMRWTLKKCQPKSDIGHCLVYLRKDAQNHVWVVVAGDRFKPAGNTYLDIEFLQNPVVRTGTSTNGGFFSAGVHGGRTVGDIIVSLGFDNTVQIYQWQPGSTPSSFSYFPIDPPAGFVFAASNPVSINAPFGAFNTTNYATGTFAEVAVDAAGIIGGPSEEIGCGDILGGVFGSVWIKSKSSRGENASLIDFVEPFQLPTNFSAAVAANYFYFDLNKAQISASVLPGSADDYIISWSPGGAIIDGVLNTNITGSLNDIHSYNPVFTGDAGFPCASYIWNIGLIRKSDNCLVGRGRVILRPPCDRIGKPINPDQMQQGEVLLEENLSTNHELRVFPNPANGSATVTLTGTHGVKEITLVDMKGGVVRRWSGISTNTLQLKNLPAGLYLLKVFSKATGKTFTKKIVVDN